MAHLLRDRACCARAVLEMSRASVRQSEASKLHSSALGARHRKVTVIPQDRDTDPEDVVWGLQTAGALWKSGARTDAIVWLRRAAQAAGDASDDYRALELARSAADLCEWMARARAAPARMAPAAESLVIISNERAVWWSNREPERIERYRRPKLDDPRLVMLSDPDSRRAASFRLLRDNLVTKENRIIMVSSGAPKEGKTTCAINLALAMSERPLARVLLVEGNFSAPSLGEIFRIDASTPAVPSMDSAWLLPYRIAQFSQGLHVAAIIKSGAAPAPTFERCFGAVIGPLSTGRYDYVIIDAAPLDGSAATMQIASFADGTLLAARSGGTTARALHRAVHLIPRGRALGVVLMEGEI
jgi:Mrp family chromosome partitioning ATPase